MFLWGNHVIIPKPLHMNELESLHEAHSGMSQMKCLVRSYFWLVKADEGIEIRLKRVTLAKNINQSLP